MASKKQLDSIVDFFPKKPVSRPFKSEYIKRKKKKKSVFFYLGLEKTI